MRTVRQKENGLLRGNDLTEIRLLSAQITSHSGRTHEEAGIIKGCNHVTSVDVADRVGKDQVKMGQKGTLERGDSYARLRKSESLGNAAKRDEKPEDR